MVGCSLLVAACLLLRSQAALVGGRAVSPAVAAVPRVRPVVVPALRARVRAAARMSSAAAARVGARSVAPVTAVIASASGAAAGGSPVVDQLGMGLPALAVTCEVASLVAVVALAVLAAI